MSGPRLPGSPGPEIPVYVISVAAELTGLHPQTLRAYDRIRCLLRDELGISPSAALQQVHERLLGSQPL